MMYNIPVSAKKVLSVGEMIQDLQAHAKKIHKKKPRLAGLLMNAAYAMKQLVDRLDQYENPRRTM